MKKSFSLFAFGIGILSSTIGFSDGTPSQPSPSLLPYWVRGDFIYAQMREGRLQFATKPESSTGIFDPSKEHLLSPHFAWEFDFRLQAGRSWENVTVFLNWSHFTGKAHRKLKTSYENQFFPVWNLRDDIFTQDFAQQSKIHWSNTVDFIDLASQLNLVKVPQYFQLQSRLALRTGWGNQSVHVDYSQGIFVGGADRVRMSSHNWGLGPLLGLDVEVMMPQGFSIPISVAGTSFFSQFHTHQKETYLDEVAADWSRRSWKTQWILDVSAALQWKKRFDSCSLSLSAGYEFHELWGENNFSQNRLGLLSGLSRSLFISGVSGSMRIDF